MQKVTDTTGVIYTDKNISHKIISTDFETAYFGLDSSVTLVYLRDTEFADIFKM